MSEVKYENFADLITQISQALKPASYYNSKEAPNKTNESAITENFKHNFSHTLADHLLQRKSQIIAMFQYLPSRNSIM